MKKVKNSSTDLQQRQGLELSKKLYRSITEQAKRLDDARSCARTVSDLFTPNLQIQRRKLCEYCERLIFVDPIQHGKKGEELLWRKSFYDVVSTAKKLKRNKEFTTDQIANLEAHINAGIGFYHHLVSKIQCEFGLNLAEILDFPILNYPRKKDVTAGILEWAGNCVYQSLIYLGDLSRYRLEFSVENQSHLCYRYYLQAISFKPDHGMPHNQIGTLAMSLCKFLDAAYHYMRCLSCTHPFDGTLNNLQSLFEKNSTFIEQLKVENPPVENGDSGKSTTSNIKQFIGKFLLLIDTWYFNKKLPKVYSLCHETYKELEECLIMSKTSRSSCDSPTETETKPAEVSDHLTHEMLFKLVVICLLCIAKLQRDNSHQTSTAVAFTLAIYSQLVQNVTNLIQESILNFPIPPPGDPKIEPSNNGIIKELRVNKKHKRNASKLRRRKPLQLDSDSDVTDEDGVSSDSESSEDDSFASDSGNILAESSDEELTDTKKSDESVIAGDGRVDNVDVIKKMKRMNVNDMLEIVTEERSLQCIKIVNDWLTQNPDIIKSCGTNTRSLLRQITNLINLLHVNVKSSKLNGVKVDSGMIKNEVKIPLSEDIALKGCDMLTKAHSGIEWDYWRKRSMSSKEESVIRVIKFLAFGKLLTNIDESGVTFDQENSLFLCKSEESSDNKTSSGIVEDLDWSETAPSSVIPSKIEDTGTPPDTDGQLTKMKHMGQLWLASEVRALENRVRGKTSLSPYLVLDADALIKYNFMVKHLVSSRKFIVVIPSAVVSALDDLKREQSEARDAIRWLESQFHRGNRFFRAQRPQERAAIPLIKYPKKKDREMTAYIQVIECCYFLAEQQKGASNVVTLLIGNQNILANGENKEFSYLGLAQSAGVAVEVITQFYNKWKKSCKGNKQR